MPVVGTICCRTGEPARFEDCIQCAKTGKPAPCKHPLHLLESMRGNDGSRKGAGISVTTLLGCHRRAQLHQAVDYYEDPGIVEARFKGTLVHEGMERMADGHSDLIMEVRYGRTISPGDGAYITGKMDMILPDYNGGARIVDFKSAGRRNLGPDMVPSESHVEQVNVYRWIVENGFAIEPTVTVDNSGAVPIIRKDHELIGLKVGSAAILYIGDTAMQEVEIPLWPIAKTQDFVERKYEEYTAKRLAPILPDKITKRRSKAKQAVIVFDDDEEEVVTEQPLVKVEPHWMCKGCALFDYCRSLPSEGVNWDEQPIESSV